MTPDYTLSRNFSGNLVARTCQHYSRLRTHSIVVRLVTVKVHCHFHSVSVSRTRALPTRRTGHRITARVTFSWLSPGALCLRRPRFDRSTEVRVESVFTPWARSADRISYGATQTHARKKERANVPERTRTVSEFSDV